MTTFGEKLRNLRTLANKTQGQVVEEINVLYPDAIHLSQTSLSALEGRRTAPRQSTLDVLAKYYNVPILTFFDSDGEPDTAWQYPHTICIKAGCRKGITAVSITDNGCIKTYVVSAGISFEVSPESLNGFTMTTVYTWMTSDQENNHDDTP